MVASGDTVGKLTSADGMDKPVYLCSMAQDFDDDDVIRIPNCELLIDSGNTACDLVLTYHDASKFKLKVTKRVKTINQADGQVAVVLLIPQILVTFALAQANGIITEKSDYLDVWVKLKEVPEPALPKAFREALVAERLKNGVVEPPTAVHSSTPPTTPRKASSPLPAEEAVSAPVNKVSPVKHLAHGSANLGKSGAKKLKLKYDFETNEIYFMEDNPLEFPEL